MHNMPVKQLILTGGVDLSGFDRLQRGLDAPPPCAGARRSIRAKNIVNSIWQHRAALHGSPS
jgi:hypothetical protein